MSLTPFKLRQAAAFFEQPPSPNMKPPPAGSFTGLLRGAADEIVDAQADALRLHQEKMVLFDALLEMRCRDDRNGSLPKAYRDIIDGALTTGNKTHG